MSDFRHIVMVFHNDDGDIRNNHMDYASKNNLHSLKLVNEHLENSYIVPCDIWCDRNPFHRHELYSWYMVSDLVDNESNVRVNRKMELVTVPEASGGNAMIGICYLVKDDADIVEQRTEELCKNQRYDGKIDWMITLVPLAIVIALCILFFFVPEQSNAVLSQGGGSALST